MTGLLALALAAADGPGKLLEELKAAPSPRPPGAVGYFLRAGDVDSAVSELAAILAGGRASSPEEDARLAVDLLEAYQASRRLELARAARKILDRMARDLASRPDCSGLALSALAKGHQILEEPEYLKAAKRMKVRRDATFTRGLLDLYESTFDPDLLDRALSLRPKHSDDPAVVCSNLLRLALIFDRPDLRQRAKDILAKQSGRMEREPLAALPLMSASLAVSAKPKQVVIAGALDDPATREMLRLVHSRFIPDRILIVAAPGPVQKRLARHMPALRGMIPIGGKTTAYICVDFSCELPTSDLKVAARLLEPRPAP